MMLEKGENENISDVKVNDAIIGYDFIDNGNTMNSHGVIILESGNRLKFYIQDIDAMIKFCKKNNRDTRLNNIIDGTN